MTKTLGSFTRDELVEKMRQIGETADFSENPKNRGHWRIKCGRVFSGAIVNHWPRTGTANVQSGNREALERFMASFHSGTVPPIDAPTLPNKIKSSQQDLVDAKRARTCALPEEAPSTTLLKIPSDMCVDNPVAPLCHGQQCPSVRQHVSSVASDGITMAAVAVSGCLPRFDLADCSFAFTGQMWGCDRTVAEKRVKALGATVVAKNVWSTTTFLVVGDYVEDGRSVQETAKYKKARELVEKAQKEKGKRAPAFITGNEFHKLVQWAGCLAPPAETASVSEHIPPRAVSAGCQTDVVRDVGSLAATAPPQQFQVSMAPSACSLEEENRRLTASLSQERSQFEARVEELKAEMCRIRQRAEKEKLGWQSQVKALEDKLNAAETRLRGDTSSLEIDDLKIALSKSQSEAKVLGEEKRALEARVRRLENGGDVATKFGISDERLQCIVEGLKAENDPRISLQSGRTFDEKIKDAERNGDITSAMASKLHDVRRSRNRACHEEPGSFGTQISSGQRDWEDEEVDDEWLDDDA